MSAASATLSRTSRSWRVLVHTVVWSVVTALLITLNAAMASAGSARAGSEVDEISVGDRVRIAGQDTNSSSSFKNADSIVATGALFSRLYDLDVDARGNVYILEKNINSDNSRIVQVSTSGGASVVAGEGSTEKPSSTKNLDARSWKIKKPADLAVDRQGAIYVAEENGNVYKVNDGKVNRIADGLGGAVQLAVDADGVLYVADNANDTVYKYTGYNQRTKIVGGRTAADMMFGPDGNLYLADRSRNRIEKIENGNWSLVSYANKPSQVAVDSVGRVFWVEDESGINVVGGSRIRERVNSDATMPGMVISKTGDLYWTEYNKGKTAVVSKASVRGSSTQMEAPVDVVTSPAFDHATDGYATDDANALLALNPVDIQIAKPTRGTPVITFWTGTWGRIANHGVLKDVCTWVGESNGRTSCELKPASKWTQDDFSTTVFLSFDTTSKSQGNPRGYFEQSSGDFAPATGLKVTVEDAIGVWDASSQWDQVWNGDAGPQPAPRLRIDSTIPSELQPGSEVSGSVTISNIGGVPVGTSELAGFIPAGIEDWSVKTDNKTSCADGGNGPTCTFTDPPKTPSLTRDSSLQIKPDSRSIEVSFTVPEDYGAVVGDRLNERGTLDQPMTLTSSYQTPGTGVRGYWTVAPAATNPDAQWTDTEDATYYPCTTCEAVIDVQPPHVSPGTAYPGDSIDIISTISNNGEVPSEATTLSVSMAGGALVGKAPSVPVIEPGDSAEVSYQVKVDPTAQPATTEVVTSLDGSASSAPFVIADGGAAALNLSAKRYENGGWVPIDDGAPLALPYAQDTKVRFDIANPSPAGIEAGQQVAVDVQLPPGVTLVDAQTNNTESGDTDWADAVEDAPYGGSAQWTSELHHFTTTVTRADGLTGRSDFQGLTLTLNAEADYSASLPASEVIVSSSSDTAEGDELRVASAVAGAPAPGLELDAQDTKRFIEGKQGELTFTVTNSDEVGEVRGPIRVTVPWDQRLTVDATSGDGWLCEMQVDELICSNDASLAAGKSLPELTVLATAAPGTKDETLKIWPTVTYGTMTMVEPIIPVTPLTSQIGGEVFAEAGDVQAHVPALTAAPSTEGISASGELDWSAGSQPPEYEATLVKLQGETSGGFQGEPLSLMWRQLCLTKEEADGDPNCKTGQTPQVEWKLMADQTAPDNATPSFYAPDVDETTFLVFELSADNGFDSDTSITGVEIDPGPGQAPEVTPAALVPAPADAGDVVQGTAVELQVPLTVNEDRTGVHVVLPEEVADSVSFVAGDSYAAGPDLGAGTETTLGLVIDTTAMPLGVNSFEYRVVYDDQPEEEELLSSVRISVVPTPAQDDPDVGKPQLVTPAGVLQAGVLAVCDVSAVDTPGAIVWRVAGTTVTGADAGYLVNQSDADKELVCATIGADGEVTSQAQIVGDGVYAAVPQPATGLGETPRSADVPVTVDVAAPIRSENAKPLSYCSFVEGADERSEYGDGFSASFGRWSLAYSPEHIGVRASDCQEQTEVGGATIFYDTWLAFANTTASLGPAGVSISTADVLLPTDWEVPGAVIDPQNPITIGYDGIVRGRLILSDAPFLSAMQGHDVTAGLSFGGDSLSGQSITLDASIDFRGQTVTVTGAMNDDGTFSATVSVPTSKGRVEASVSRKKPNDDLSYSVGPDTGSLNSWALAQIGSFVRDQLTTVKDKNADICTIVAAAGANSSFSTEAGWRVYPGELSTDISCDEAGVPSEGTVRVSGAAIALFDWLSVADATAVVNADGSVLIESGAAVVPGDWKIGDLSVPEDAPLELGADGVVTGSLRSDTSIPFVPMPGGFSASSTTWEFGSDCGSGTCSQSMELTATARTGSQGNEVSFSGSVATDGSFSLAASVEVSLVGLNPGESITGTISRADADAPVIAAVSYEVPGDVELGSKSMTLSDSTISLSTDTGLRLQSTVKIMKGSAMELNAKCSMALFRGPDALAAGDWKWNVNQRCEWTWVTAHAGPVAVVGDFVDALGLGWNGDEVYLGAMDIRTEQHWNPVPNVEVREFDFDLVKDESGDPLYVKAMADITLAGKKADGSLTDTVPLTATACVALSDEGAKAAKCGEVIDWPDNVRDELKAPQDYEMVLTVDTNTTANQGAGTAGRAVELLPNLQVSDVHAVLGWDSKGNIDDYVEFTAYVDQLLPKANFGGLSIDAAFTYRGSLFSENNNTLIIAELGNRKPWKDGGGSNATRQNGVVIYSSIPQNVDLSHIDANVPRLNNFVGWGYVVRMGEGLFTAKFNPGQSTGNNFMFADFRIYPSIDNGIAKWSQKLPGSWKLTNPYVQIMLNADQTWTYGMAMTASWEYDDGKWRDFTGGFWMGALTADTSKTVGGLSRLAAAFDPTNGTVQGYFKLDGDWENAFGLKDFTINEASITWGHHSGTAQCQNALNPDDPDSIYDLPEDCFDENGKLATSGQYSQAQTGKQAPWNTGTKESLANPEKQNGWSVGFYADVTLPEYVRKPIGMDPSTHVVAAFNIGAQACYMFEFGTPGSKLPAAKPMKPISDKLEDTVVVNYGRIVSAPRGCTIADHAFWGWNYDLEGSLMGVDVALRYQFATGQIFGQPFVSSEGLIDIGEFRFGRTFKFDHFQINVATNWMLGNYTYQWKFTGGMHVFEEDFEIEAEYRQGSVQYDPFGLSGPATGSDPFLGAVYGSGGKGALAKEMFKNAEVYFHLRLYLDTSRAGFFVGLWWMQELDLEILTQAGVVSTPKFLFKFNTTLVPAWEPHKENPSRMRLESLLDWSGYQPKRIYGRVAVDFQTMGLDASGSAMFNYEKGKGIEGRIGNYCTFFNEEDAMVKNPYFNPEKAESEDNPKLIPAVNGCNDPTILNAENQVATEEEGGSGSTQQATAATRSIEAQWQTTQVFDDVPEEVTQDDLPHGVALGESVPEFDQTTLLPEQNGWEKFRIVVPGGQGMPDWTLAEVTGVFTSDYLAIDTEVSPVPYMKPVKAHGRIIWGDPEDGVTIRNSAGDMVQAHKGDFYLGAENVGLNFADWLGMSGDFHIGYLKESGLATGGEDTRAGVQEIVDADGEPTRGSEFYMQARGVLGIGIAKAEVYAGFSTAGTYEVTGIAKTPKISGLPAAAMLVSVHGDGGAPTVDLSSEVSFASLGELRLAGTVGPCKPASKDACARLEGVGKLDAGIVSFDADVVTSSYEEDAGTSVKIASRVGLWDIDGEVTVMDDLYWVSASGGLGLPYLPRSLDVGVVMTNCDLDTGCTVTNGDGQQELVKKQDDVLWAYAKVKLGNHQTKVSGKTDADFTKAIGGSSKGTKGWSGKVANISYGADLAYDVSAQLGASKAAVDLNGSAKAYAKMDYGFGKKTASVGADICMKADVGAGSFSTGTSFKVFGKRINVGAC